VGVVVGEEQVVLAVVVVVVVVWVDKPEARQPSRELTAVIPVAVLGITGIPVAAAAVLLLLNGKRKNK
jgi:hypothetical protein